MCGIFGVAISNDTEVDSSALRETVDELFMLSESRGKEASGLAVLYGDAIKVYKQPIPGSRLIQREMYDTLFNGVIANGDSDSSLKGPLAIIGHSRLATNGIQTSNDDNQPVLSQSAVGIHNGIVVNVDDLWSSFPKLERKYQVDTEIILSLISWFHDSGYSMKGALRETYKQISGAASIATLLENKSSLLLATNTGSLYFQELRKPKAFIFASEEYILRKLNPFNIASNGFGSEKVVHLHPGKGCLVDIPSLATETFSLNGNGVRISNKKRRSSLFKIENVSNKDKEKLGGEKDMTLIVSKANSLKRLEKHMPDYAAIEKIKRCKKCILPETMPLIELDMKGVCNFCSNHKKIKVRGKRALEKLVAPLRSKDGEPDCIVALSGGRDSSYGLHYMKKVLKMNPIAYTYDWGMVTDLARRNQSRITGELGIEHIVVSADIKKKRQNIAKNIQAWMKRPDLGIVPLFMAGDKQAEYYAEDVRRKTGVDLIIYCRGNEIENEEFKWGHCGIADGSPGGVLHNLSFKGKMQLAMYYAKEYLLNPTYINSSLWDTLFAYGVAYMMPHNFEYLWHYIMWDEKEIVNTLIREYGWEVSAETKATWRIDDGSVPFYNYIYYVVQGFTENDTFRSNQIREGVMTRQKALKLIGEENVPRYEGMKWYFDQIGLDGNEVLSVVDRMPKMYDV